MTLFSQYHIQSADDLLCLALRNFAYHQRRNFLVRGIGLSDLETWPGIFKHEAGYGGSQRLVDDSK